MVGLGGGGCLISGLKPNHKKLIMQKQTRDCQRALVKITCVPPIIVENHRNYKKLF